MNEPTASGCAKCGGPLGSSIGGVCYACAATAMLAGGEEDDVIPAWPGTSAFSRYELIEELGRGGMGIVYRARHREVGRIVALKRMKSGASDSAEKAARFRAEIDAVAALDHPNIVPIYDIGENEGTAFYTMKLVDGGSLAERIDDLSADSSASSETPGSRSGSGESLFQSGLKRPGGRGALVMAKVARAVHYAHERGILHRDLKPSNILLDAAAEPYVTDFGLAKRLDAESDLTLTGAIVGTPNYMSPEQARGENRNLTTASDVFSLGAILYHVVVGRKPFDGESPLDVIRNVSETEVRDPRSISLRVGRNLATICLKAMAREPARRYANAGELADDLERWLRGEPIAARMATPLEQVASWARRKPALAALVAVTGIAITVIFGLTVASRQRLKSERDTIERLAEEKAGESERAREATRARTEQLNRIEFREADALFDASARRHGVAVLAGIVRRSPEFRPAWERALSEIARDIDTELAFEPVELSGAPKALEISPDGRFAYVAVDNGARVVDLVSGAVTPERFAHENLVTRLDLTADGSRLATASLDQKARVWDAVSGEPVTESLAIGAKADWVGFSADGKSLFTVGWPAVGKIWDLEKGGEPSALGFVRGAQPVIPSRDGAKWLMYFDQGDASRVRVFNRDGSEVGKPLAVGRLADRRFWVSPTGARHAFTAEDDLTVSVHSMKDNRRLYRAHHETTVSAAAWSRDGRYLATASSGGVARLWDGETGGSVGRAMRHVRAVTAMAFNRDAGLLATACEDRIVRVWSLPDGNLLRSGLRHESPIALMDFRGSAEGLVTVTKGGVVRCWRVDSAKSWGGSTVKHQRALTCLEFIGEGEDALVAVGARGVTLSLSRAKDGSEVAKNETAGAWVYCLQHEPKRDLLAVGGRGKRIAFLSGRDLTPLREPLGGFGWVKEFQFGPEGKLLAVMGLSRRARAIEVETGRRLWVSPATRIYAFTMDLSPDGRLVAVAYEDWTVRYFDAWTGEVPIPSLKVSQTAMALAFSPDSSALAAGLRDGWLLIVDHRSGRVLHRLKHDGAITAVAYTGDGRHVVSASEDGFARVWDVREGRLSAPPMDHGARVTGLALDPSGKRMLTGCRDGRARFWDVETGLEIGASVAHQAPVAMVRVSRDGRWAGSAGQDGVARIWRLPEAGLGDRAPDWLADFLEAKAETRVEKDGRLIALAREEIAERLAKVPSDTADPFVAAVKKAARDDGR